MKTTSYSYMDGLHVIPHETNDGIIRIIENLQHSLGKYDIKKFKEDFSYQLKTKGWSGQAKLSSCSSISITSILRNVGLCVQTGNMARMYADLVKLQALYFDGKIKAAIFVLPTKSCANSFGTNVANYERLLRELTNVFYKVITVPMVIIGFENEDENK